MKEKINMEVDTTAIDQEISNYRKQLRHSYALKDKLIEEIDGLDLEDKHYNRRKSDLDDRLYKAYDYIEEYEKLLQSVRAKKTAIEAQKITGQNIYQILICFDKLYEAMDEVDRRRLMESLLEEIQVYPEKQPNGQWLKSIQFKLPIIEDSFEMSLDNGSQIETVVLLSRKDV